MGVGERASRYAFENTDLQRAPASQTLNLADIFAPDTISLSRVLKLTLALKIADEPYAGTQVMPSVTSDRCGAAVGAVHMPTPVDADLRAYSGLTPQWPTNLAPGAQLAPRVAFSLSTYYDAYDDLRSITPGDSASGLPRQFGNLMAGTIHGVEIWGSYQVTNGWRPSAGFDLSHEDLRFLAGSRMAADLGFVADDPNHPASAYSSMNLGDAVTCDAYLRNVGMLPHPGVPADNERDLRLGRDIAKALQISLSGFQSAASRAHGLP